MWQELVPLYNGGQFEDVIAHCKSALDRTPRDPRLSLLLASAYQSLGLDEEALSLFLPLHELFLDNEEISGRLFAVLRRLAVAARHRGAREVAIAYLERALALTPQAEDVRRELTEQMTMMGRILESMGEWHRAAEWMQRAYRTSPREEFRQYALKMEGLDEAQKGNTLNAIRLLQNSISSARLSESYDTIRIVLQELLPLHDRGFPHLILPLVRHTKPAEVENIYFVAHMLLVRDQALSKARAFCASLLETVPNNDVVHIALGAAEEIAGRPAEARAHYDIVLQHSPDHPAALQGIAALEQLPSPPASQRQLIKRHRLPKPSLNIVVYSNCQGRPLCYLLENVLGSQYNCQTTFIRNYEMAHAYSLQCNHEAIQKADIVLYQPQRVIVDGGSAFTVPGALAPRLAEDCVALSFPYVFNAALWPVVHDGGCLVSGDHFVNLLARGIDPDRLWELYEGDGLDFEFTKRWDDTIRILAERELATDIKFAPFITTEIRRQCLFTGHRHPRYPVYVEGARQILAILRGRGVTGGDTDLEDVAQQKEFIEFSRRLFSCEFFPVDRYAQRHYQFEWVRPDGHETAARYYRMLLKWAATGALRMDSSRRSDG